MDSYKATGHWCNVMRSVSDGCLRVTTGHDIGLFRDVAPIVRVPESSAALESEDKGDESAYHGR